MKLYMYEKKMTINMLLQYSRIKGIGITFITAKVMKVIITEKFIQPLIVLKQFFKFNSVVGSFSSIISLLIM